MTKKFLAFLAFLVILPACSPAEPISAQTTQVTPAGEVAWAREETEYHQIRLPGDEGITFELPKPWTHYGNGSAFSPDGGVTLFGMKQAWNKAGSDPDTALMGESVQILDMKQSTVEGKATKCYTVLLFQPLPPGAVQSEPKEIGYEYGCIFRSEDGKQKIDLFVRSEQKEALEALKPVVYHAVSSFKMK